MIQAVIVSGVRTPVGATGPSLPEQWGAKSQGIDFFDHLVGR